MAQDVLDVEADVDASDPAVRRVKTVSNLLDSAIRIPGTNFKIGLDPILGILPIGGDAVATAISLYIIFEGIRADLPRDVLVRMGLYVAIDAVIGSVPVLGTVFDAFWKANEWNANLIEEHVEGTR